MHVDAACSAAPHRLLTTAANVSIADYPLQKAHIYVIKFAPGGPYGSGAETK